MAAEFHQTLSSLMPAKRAANLRHICSAAQEGLKGSQGAGKVDETLDRTGNTTVETDSKPMGGKAGPRQAGASAKRKGKGRK